MSKVYLFGEFKLDVKNWTLHRGNTLVALPPKILDTLIYLATHAGETVSYEEVMRNVWPGQVIGPSSLKRNISIIRSALEDEPPYQIITTVSRRGLRFAAPVAIHDDDSPETQRGVETPVAGLPIAVVSGKLSSRRAFNYSLLFALAVIATALLFVVMLITPKFHSSVFVAEQITTNSEEIPIAAAAVSPSGNKLAFADEKGLFVGDIRGLERHPVQLPDGLKPNYIQWFADEFHLLVTGTNTTSAGTTLWKIAIFGGKPTLLLENVSLATASANGQRIAFIRNSDEMWIADGDGTNTRLLTKAEPNTTFTLGSRMSANGQSVIMGTYDPLARTSTIASMQIDTGKKAIVHVYGNYIADFLLLNNQELLVARDLTRRSFETELALVVPGQSTSGTRDTQAHRVAYWPGNTNYSIAASYNNKIITLINTREFAAQYVADLQNGGGSIGNLRRINHPSDQSYPVEWLADNRTLLYIAVESDKLSIFSQRIDSVETNALVKDPHDNLRPAVTADQRWLFYFSRDRSPESVSRDPLVSLMKKPLAGGEPSLVDTRNDIRRGIRCAKTINFCVVAENNSDKTTFSAFDPDKGRGNELYSIDWSSSKITYDWDLSADGKRIGYADLNHSPIEIHLVYLDQVPITSTVVAFDVADSLRSLRWDAETKGFFASSSNANGDSLSLLHLYTNGSVKVLQRDLNSEDSYMIGSADGKYLAFNKWLKHSNIWLLQRE